MPTYLFRAEINPDKADIRAERRPAHLDYQAGFESLAGGPMVSDEGAPTGTFAIFEASSSHAANDRIAGDPYMQSDIFTTWSLDQISVMAWSNDGPSA